MIAMGLLLATALFTQWVGRAFELKKDYAEKRGGLMRKIAILLYHWENEIVRPEDISTLTSNLRKYIEREVSTQKLILLKKWMKLRL